MRRRAERGVLAGGKRNRRGGFPRAAVRADFRRGGVSAHVAALHVKLENGTSRRHIRLGIREIARLDGGVSAEDAVFDLELFAAGDAGRIGEVVIELRLARELRDFELEAVDLVRVARRQVPEERNIRRAHARNALELDALLRAIARLEIGEDARRAAGGRCGIEVFPANRAAPAVVRVDPAHLTVCSGVIDRIAVDDHLVDGRVDLDGRAEGEVVGNGGPEVVVAVALATHDGARLVPPVFRLGADFLVSAARAGLEGNLGERLHPAGKQRRVVCRRLVGSERRGRSAGSGDFVPIDRDAPVVPDSVCRPVAVVVEVLVGEGTRLLETVRPAPETQFLSARGSGASARRAARRQVVHRRALPPIRAEHRRDEHIARVSGRRAQEAPCSRRGSSVRLRKILPAGIVGRRLVRHGGCYDHVVSGKPRGRRIALGRLDKIILRKRQHRLAFCRARDHDISRRGKPCKPQIAARLHARDCAPCEDALRDRTLREETLRRLFRRRFIDLGAAPLECDEQQCRECGCPHQNSFHKAQPSFLHLILYQNLTPL